MDAVRLEVSHLPSSSSFYASILQPLGLSYFCSERYHDGCDTVVFGSHDRGFLNICEVSPTTGKLRLACVALSGPSQTAVEEFYRAGLRAIDSSGTPRHLQAGMAYQTTTSKSHAILEDFDGNRIEAIYQVPSANHMVIGTSASVKKSQDVSSSFWLHSDYIPGPNRSANTQVDISACDDRSFAVPRPSQSRQQPAPAAASAPPSAVHCGSKSFAAAGAVLGAITGAAITYGLMASGPSQIPSNEAASACKSYDGMRSDETRYKVKTKEGSSDNLSRRARQTMFEETAEPFSQAKNCTESRHGTKLLPAPDKTVGFKHLFAASRLMLTCNVFDEDTKATASTSSFGREHVLAAASHAVNTHSRLATRLKDKSETGVGTFVSAKTHRSSVERKGSALDALNQRHSSSSHGPNSTGQSKSGHSKLSSAILPNQVPLPPSNVGSSHANWSDQLKVVEPSDSVSCAGAKPAIG